MKFKQTLKYAAAIVALALMSCDPLEDVYKELDMDATDKISSDVSFTMTDDDYETADDACGCARFGNFSSEDDVKVGVPAVLSSNHPGLGKGSTAVVTYDFYNGSSPDYKRDRDAPYDYLYFSSDTVMDAEYDELGFRFGNFSDLSKDIPLYADFKEPGARDGYFMDINHKYYNGSGVETLTSRAVFTVAYGWQYVFILPDDAYGDFFGESGTDFSNAGEGREMMPIYLNENFRLFVEEGAILAAQYNYDDRFGDLEMANVPDVGLYIRTAGEWLLYNDHYQVTEESLSFGHDGTTWVPDNTIKNALSSADHDAIAAQYMDTPRGANLEQFGSFDRRASSSNFWSDDHMLEALAWWLNNSFPGVVNVDGQKYVLSVIIYNGAVVPEDFSLIREAGVWVMNN